MSIGEFRTLCLTYGYLETKMIPVNTCSWRGYDAEACIIVEDGVGELIDFVNYLDELMSGDEYCGHKGGEYIYDEYTTLHFELDARHVADIPSIMLMIGEGV